MNLNYAYQYISAEEYLQGELLADVKHELVDGQVYATAGDYRKIKPLWATAHSSTP